MRMNHKKVAITELSFLIPSIIKFHKKIKKTGKCQSLYKNCVPPFYGPQSQCSLPWPMFPICSFLWSCISVSPPPFPSDSWVSEGNVTVLLCRLSWYVGLHLNIVAALKSKAVQAVMEGRPTENSSPLISGVWNYFSISLLLLKWLYFSPHETCSWLGQCKLQKT